VDVLLDYTAGRLDAARSAKVEKHVRRCESCATFRMGQAEVWAALDGWDAPPVSSSFDRRVWQKIGEAAAAPWHRRLADALRFPAWKPAVPLAATMLVIAAGFVFDHRAPRATQPRGAEVQGVSITEVDQVEKALDDIQLLRQFDAAASSRPM
jgi:anti-sigma factor RsiW